MWDLATIENINQLAAEAIVAGKTQRIALEQIVDMAPTTMLWTNVSKNLESSSDV